MRKTMAFLLIGLAVGAAMAAPLYCAEDLDNPNNRIFEGKVVSIDTGKAFVTVRGAIDIEFPISPDTKFYRNGNEIRMSDVAVNDYVTVDYIREGLKSRKPKKTVGIIVEYRDKDNQW